MKGFLYEFVLELYEFALKSCIQKIPGACVFFILRKSFPDIRESVVGAYGRSFRYNTAPYFKLRAEVPNCFSIITGQDSVREVAFVRKLLNFY